MKSRIVRALVSLASAALLGGCGGSLYFGWGDSGDAPPSVSLASAVSAAAPGQAVHLAAAATDDFGVARVDFYRIEPDGRRTALGSDTAEPYAWDAVMPDTTAASVSFVATAVDGAGQATDSAPVTVTVSRQQRS